MVDVVQAEGRVRQHGGPGAEGEAGGERHLGARAHAQAVEVVVVGDDFQIGLGHGRQLERDPEGRQVDEALQAEGLELLVPVLVADQHVEPAATALAPPHHARPDVAARVGKSHRDQITTGIAA